MSEDLYADIRAAYRLLHDYHARARDTMGLFVRSLGGWTPYYHSKFVGGLDSRTRDPLNPGRWAWDFLPNHTAAYYFVEEGRTGVPEAGDRVLALYHCSDTSLDTARSFAGLGNVLETNPVRTGILALSARALAPSKDYGWYHVLNSSDWKSGKGETFVTDEQAGPSLKVARRFIGFSSMESETAIQEQAKAFKALMASAL